MKSMHNNFLNEYNNNHLFCKSECFSIGVHSAVSMHFRVEINLLENYGIKVSNPVISNDRDKLNITHCWTSNNRSSWMSTANGKQQSWVTSSIMSTVSWGPSPLNLAGKYNGTIRYYG